MPTFNLSSEDKNFIVEAVTAAREEASQGDRQSYDSILTELSDTQMQNNTIRVQFSNEGQRLIASALDEKGRLTAMTDDGMGESMQIDALARRIRRATGGRRRTQRRRTAHRKSRRSRT